MDQSPKFAHQASIWASSLLSYANQESDSIVIHAVNQCNPNYQRFFDSLGVKTQSVKPFDYRHPHSNKLVQLESWLLQSADYVVLCDCDIAFCESISSWITGDSIRAKVVDAASLSLDHWERIYSSANLQLPTSRVKSTFDNLETLPTYCNGGLLIIPQPIYQALRKVWPEWNRWLLERPELLEPHAFFTDQVSFSLSCEALGLTIDHLPVDLNFPTHLPYAASSLVGVYPKVLHYHDRVDPSGCLLPTGVPSVDQQIEKINNLIRLTRRAGFDNFSFWEFRYSLHPDLGSGIGSRGNNLIRKRELLHVQLQGLNPTSVLDIGCGDLEVTRNLPISNYTGIDISPAAIALAQTRHPEWKFVVGDVLELDLQPHDLVICLDVVIHQPTRERYEALIKRLLDLSAKHLLLSGYNQSPWHTSEITFYFEPLSETLGRIAPGRVVEIVGGYRDTTVLSWTRAG